MAIPHEPGWKPKAFYIMGLKATLISDELPWIAILVAPAGIEPATAP